MSTEHYVLCVNGAIVKLHRAGLDSLAPELETLQAQGARVRVWYCNRDRRLVAIDLETYCDADGADHSGPACPACNLTGYHAFLCPESDETFEIAAAIVEDAKGGAL